MIYCYLFAYFYLLKLFFLFSWDNFFSPQNTGNNEYNGKTSLCLDKAIMNISFIYHILYQILSQPLFSEKKTLFRYLGTFG